MKHFPNDSPPRRNRTNRTTGDLAPRAAVPPDRFRSQPFLQLLLTAIALLCCGVGSAQAQQWKYVYGVDTTGETGHNRVIPVNLDCADGGSAGYIAVGISDVGGLPHVYVVRTNNNGARIWEKVYDIHNDSLPDEGWGIVELEDGSGFAVTGHTMSNARAEDAFIMKIDCSGNVSWTTTYGTVDHEYAYDIIQADHGKKIVMPPDVPTNKGDLVICGRVEFESQGIFHMDGYILRVTSAGTLIWSRRYDITPPMMPERHDWLWGLTEAVPTGGASAGDIIAVGQSLVNQTVGQQGLILRVDGHDGTTGNTTRQRAAHFGGAYTRGCGSDSGNSFHGDEIFYSVVEMSDSGEMDQNMVFNVAVAGSSTAPGKEEIYVVKLLGGDPCSVVEERLLGDGLDQAGTTCGFNQAAHCIREVEFEMGGATVSQYDLALTGSTDEGGDLDMYLLTISPVNLEPIAGGIRKLYGQTSTSTTLDERGRSLHPVDTLHGRTEGFILCGTNHADPVGVNDFTDLYLVKTDNVGDASSPITCEATMIVAPDTVDWDICVTPTNALYGNDTSVTTGTVTVDSDDEICTGGAKPSIRLSPQNHGTHPRLSFQVSPNPIHPGEVLTLRELRTAEGRLTLRIHDVSGAEVRSLATGIGHSPELSIPTDGLPAGVYILSIGDGNSEAAVRFTVLE